MNPAKCTPDICFPLFLKKNVQCVIWQMKVSYILSPAERRWEICHAEKEVCALLWGWWWRSWLCRCGFFFLSLGSVFVIQLWRWGMHLSVLPWGAPLWGVIELCQLPHFKKINLLNSSPFGIFFITSVVLTKIAELDEVQYFWFSLPYVCCTANSSLLSCLRPLSC